MRNNKFTTKSETIQRIMDPLMGDSILLSDSTELWSHKRKVLSTAFYKEKLVKMIALVKSVLAQTVE